MTALRHTAGPWVRDGHNLSTILHCTAERGSPEARHITGDYEVIAECEGENWAANSLAIAALPDLIETLVKARAAFIVEYDDRGRVASVRHGNDALRVLVAKLDAAIAACGGTKA